VRSHNNLPFLSRWGCFTNNSTNSSAVPFLIIIPNSRRNSPSSAALSTFGFTVSLSNHPPPSISICDIIGYYLRIIKGKWYGDNFYIEDKRILLVSLNYTFSVTLYSRYFPSISLVWASSPGSAEKKNPATGIKTYSNGVINARHSGTFFGLFGL
jgi:hypothetical protein